MRPGDRPSGNRYPDTPNKLVGFRDLKYEEKYEKSQTDDTFYDGLGSNVSS